jgi:acyl-CoA synthetase (AMP-forming)/AMP-acid ligase II
MKANTHTVIYLDPQTNRSYDYAQVQSTARAFGEGLKAQWNWRKGDVLAVFAPNCIDTPAITWGCHWAGGILSPANPAYTADELAFQLRDAGARALVTQLPFYETARKAAKSVGLADDMIILMGDERDAQRRVKHFENIRSTSAVSMYRKSKINPVEDLAFLVYSSGTTGEMMAHLKRGNECTAYQGHRKTKGSYAHAQKYRIQHLATQSWRIRQYQLERRSVGKWRQNYRFFALLPHLR